MHSSVFFQLICFLITATAIIEKATVFVGQSFLLPMNTPTLHREDCEGLKATYTKCVEGKPIGCGKWIDDNENVQPDIDTQVTFKDDHLIINIGIGDGDDVTFTTDAGSSLKTSYPPVSENDIDQQFDF